MGDFETQKKSLQEQIATAETEAEFTMDMSEVEKLNKQLEALEATKHMYEDKVATAEAPATENQIKQITDLGGSEEELVKREEVQDEKVEEVKEMLEEKSEGVVENSLEEEKWLPLKDYSFDENSFYRIINEEGYRDYKTNNILRSSPDGTPSHMVGRFDIGHRPTSFPSFDKGAPDISYAKEGEDNYIFESKIAMYKRGDKNPTHGGTIKGRHWAYRPIDQETGNVIKEMNSDMIKNIFKLDKNGNLYIKSLV